MTCQSCIDKWTRYYKNKGFPERQAKRMAKKLVIRLEKRLAKEKISYIPLYLLENGHGISFFYGRTSVRKQLRQRIHSNLYKWVFLSNWRATLMWSFRSFRPRWIGRSYNPDYTQNCSGACGLGSCSLYLEPCGVKADCTEPPATNNCLMGSCACPAPLANSTQVANNCTCAGPATACQSCSKSACQAKTFTCVTCGGTCGYNCDVGYTWNGVACVLAGAGQPYISRVQGIAGMRSWSRWFDKLLSNG